MPYISFVLAHPSQSKVAMILVNASLKITRSPFRPAGRLAICLWLVAAAGQGDILPRLNRGESLKIAAIGTSLTAEAAERPNPWFDQMGAWLNTQYPGKVTLDNEAVQGAASQSTSTTYALGGLDQLTKALANNPDAIFIEFAMNDAVASFGISQQMSKDNLQTMIDRINAWAVKEHKSVDIVIQTMNNEGGGSSGSRPNLPWPGAQARAARRIWCWRRRRGRCCWGVPLPPPRTFAPWPCRFCAIASS